MRKLVNLALVALAVLGTACTQEKKPNIIYIMCDDHAAQAVGTYGSRLAELNPTPVIDKLADEGMVFENCFVTNSICTPSRASIITGQYSQTNGALDLWCSLDTAQHYLPKEMKKLGYETAVIGKWHLHKEPQFDYYSVLDKQGHYFDPEFRSSDKGTWPDNMEQVKGHSTDVITDKVLNWLKGRKSTKPFFLMYHFKAPHDMFENAPRYDSYLEDTWMPEPKSMYDRSRWGSVATKGSNDSLAYMIGSSISDRHTNRSYTDIYKTAHLGGDKATSAAYQTYVKKYLRCVKGIDDNLERFFAYLKANGMWDNTVIVYTSDQGMILGEHDFEDKRWMYETSIHMPFIVHYPEMVKAGTRNDDMVNNVDFAPTLIELAGGKTPDYMQGRSMLPLLKEEHPADWRKANYYRYWMQMIHHDIPAHLGVRTKEYKLIFFYGRYWDATKDGTLSMYWNDAAHSNTVSDTPAAWELYDMKNDPEEMVNIYNDPAYKEVIKELKAEILRQREELNEGDENFPRLQEVIDAHWND